MNATRLHPLEEILLAIHRAAPEPWHFRSESRRQGFNVEAVGQILELLHLEGLVARGAGSAGDGPGVVLTPRGEQVLRDPEAMARLRADQPITPTDPGAIVRHSLRRHARPTLTRLIIVANLLVFAWCIFLASRHRGLLQAYLAPSILIHPAISGRVLEPAGSLSAGDLLRGRWWRLLTCCFVHGGLLHLAMNMYTLYAAGRFVEQTWGWWRYGLIYLLSGWGGSCLAMALAPNHDLVGASGAICGVLAAEGVWVFLNGKYLPRAMAQRGRTQIVTTVVLLVFISLLPGVSGHGHLGGALAGAVAAAALNALRFGAGPLRFLAVPVLVAVPVASYRHVQHSRTTSPLWQQIRGDYEVSEFTADWVPRIQGTLNPAWNDYEATVAPLFERGPDRRDPEQVEAADARLAAHVDQVEALVGGLEQAGAYRDADVVEARQAALDYARISAEVFREARRRLAAGKTWKKADDAAFRQKRIEARRLRDEWRGRLERE